MSSRKENRKIHKKKFRRKIIGTDRAFTMVELLATIVILGVVMMIAIVSITRIIEKAKKEYYSATEKEVKLAGESYVQNNRTRLPKRIGQKVKIPLKELQEDNYIKEVNDYNKKECNKEKSYVQVFKYDEDKFSYFSYLECPNYTSKQTIKSISPDIQIEFTKTGNDTDSIRSNLKTAKAKITINGSGSESEEKNVKILGYNYVVYRNNKEVISSGSINANYKEKITINLSLNKYTPGTIKIRVTANNMYGLSSNKTESMTYKDLEPPKCVIKEIDKDTNAKTWTNQNRKISVGCDDGDGIGCARVQFTKTFKTDTKIGTITIEDEAGNKALCRVSVYVDKTKPKCSIESSGTEGDNNWYISDIDLKLTTSDNLSGVSDKGLSDSSVIVYNDKTSASQTEDTKGTKWYGYVKDKAGNVGDCEKEVKRDTVKPTCTISKDGTVGDNEWYKGRKVELTLSTEDETSEVSTYELTSNANKTTQSYNRKSKAEQGDTTSGGITWYGYVKDNAGLKGKCDSGSFKVDTNAPSCNIDADGKEGNDSWFIEPPTLSLATEDSVSGLAGKDLTTSSIATYNGTTSAEQNGTASTIWYGHVKDNAGNTTTCNKTVKVDIDDPTCTISKNGTVGSNGWYKEKDVTLELDAKDATSGVDQYGMVTSRTISYNGKKEVTQGNTTSNGITWYGYVKDKAGRTGKCESGSFKVDKSPPVCKSDGGSSTWTNSDVTISGKCESDNGSGCNSTEKVEKRIDEDTNGEESPGKIYDKAGNETECPKVVVRLDKTKPNCSIDMSGTKGPNDDDVWYRSKVDLTLDKSDVSVDGVRSGTAGYKLTTSTTPSYNGTSHKATREAETSGTIYYGYVKDNAGNISSCSATVKIDKTKPVCEISLNGTMGGDNWYRSDVDLTLTKEDVEHGGVKSGIYGYRLTTSSDPLYNGTTNKVTREAETSGTTYYGYVKDNAGNTAKCHKSVKIDKTPPIYSGVEIINSRWSGGAAGQTWHIKFSVYDNRSGLASRSVSYSDAYESHHNSSDLTSIAYSTLVEHIGSSAGSITFSHRACDIAGNCKTKSGTKNKPSS